MIDNLLFYAEGLEVFSLYCVLVVRAGGIREGERVWEAAPDPQEEGGSWCLFWGTCSSTCLVGTCLSTCLSSALPIGANANILAPVRDNPSKYLLRGRPESQLSLGQIPATKSRLPNPGYWKPCGYLCLKRLSILGTLERQRAR